MFHPNNQKSAWFRGRKSLERKPASISLVRRNAHRPTHRVSYGTTLVVDGSMAPENVTDKGQIMRVREVLIVLGLLAAVAAVLLVINAGGVVNRDEGKQFPPHSIQQ